ncbi:stage II sporulation protein R [Brevibacillus parabrevis]|uniref:stage II sporulation protein R n=1 Tax=Brevibacillus parabrevis TaxID=54914 RepID=UPI00285317CE|nr:stage II sporulation protein R [Brevibacillus parabrevis]MDR4997777.1 stage II sporulation protein R [Brevibacillus parabrevis]
MKRMLLIVFSLFMLMMCWEGQLTSANVLDNGPIPQESIRLRIIANSDSVADQWLKREVRDALIAQMNTWAEDIKSFEQAQDMVASQLPVLQEVVDKTIRERGFSYKAVVDFGQVPFPTKLYGSYVYPAGNYEALRVQIGEAKGQNWWCVLFPPLCFIDMSNGDAVQAAAATTAAGKETEQSVAKSEPASVFKLDQKEIERTDWRQERLERRLDSKEVLDSADTGAVSQMPGAQNAVAVENNSKDEALEQAQAEGQADKTPEMSEQNPAPQVQVRFYLLEKLESWFS